MDTVLTLIFTLPFTVAFIDLDLIGDVSAGSWWADRSDRAARRHWREGGQRTARKPRTTRSKRR